MPRWLLWLLPVLLIAGVIALVLWRTSRDPDPEDAEEVVEELPVDEATPGRAETEEQMRAIGYVQ